jgi:hypothetical protein
VVLTAALLFSSLRTLLLNVAEDGGLLPAVFKAIRSIPFVARYVSFGLFYYGNI